MATPTSFDESDAYLSRPKEMSEDQCDPLSIKRIVVGDIPAVVSCWKLTAEELAEINRTGRVWLTIAGYSMPPAVINGIKPI